MASTSTRSGRPSLRPFLPRLVLLGALSVACTDREASAPKGAASKAAASPGGGGEQAAKPQDGATLAYQQAQALLLKGEPEQAEKELQRTVALDPRMSEAFFELGKLEMHLSTRGGGEGGGDGALLERGLVALAQAVKLEPSNDSYLFWLGRAQVQKGDKTAAIQSFEKAVQVNPKNGQAWKRLGLVHVDEGHTEQARDCFAKAIEATPEDSGAYLQLGRALEALGDTAGARSSYEKAIEVDPTDAEYYHHMAELLKKLGDQEGASQAEQAFHEWEGYATKLTRRMNAVNQRPNDAAALRRLGEMYYQVGKWEEAGEWFLKAVHLDPKDALAHLYSGSVRRQLKDYDAALNHLKEADYLAPDSLDAKLELVRLYADMGQAESLTELVSTVETSAATNGEWLYQLGVVCQEVGRAEDATRLLAAAKALGVTEPAPESKEPAEGD